MALTVSSREHQSKKYVLKYFEPHWEVKYFEIFRKNVFIGALFIISNYKNMLFLNCSTGTQHQPHCPINRGSLCCLGCDAGPEPCRLHPIPGKPDSWDPIL
jgi:hypothetical protein